MVDFSTDLCSSNRAQRKATDIFRKATLLHSYNKIFYAASNAHCVSKNIPDIFDCNL